VWAALLLLVAVAWWGSLEAPFVYDDRIEVVGNRTIRMLEEWRAIGAYNVSRPILIFTYAWNFDQFGLEPFGYHVTNVAVFGAAIGAALFLAEGVARLLKVSDPLARAAAVVALWAVHPMVTESVTYTTGRSETLCALFSFLALGAWARGLRAEGEGERGWTWRLAAIAAFVAAALSKEVGGVVPAAALALEWIALGVAGVDRVRRREWAWYLPFAGAIAVAIGLRLAVVGALLPHEVDRSVVGQLVTSAEVWRHYLTLWLVPVGQTIFHDQPDVAPSSLRGLLAVGGWLVMIGGGVLWGRRRPAAGFALVAAGLSLVPSTSFVMLVEHMAEHRSLQAGFYLLLAIGLSIPALQVRRAGVAAALLVPVLVLATRARNAVWTSETDLWAEATVQSPESAQAWYGLGSAHRFSGTFTEAIAPLERAIALDPNYLSAWMELGIAHAEGGNFDGARDAWTEALRIRPSYCKAHNNLGSLAYRRGLWDESRRELQSTLAYCPHDPIAHYMLGEIYYGPRRDTAKALLHYERVVVIEPQFQHIGRVKERILELTW
jgi:protein O-mannosyl-transferase